MSERNDYDYNEYLWNWQPNISPFVDDGEPMYWVETDDERPVWTPPRWLIVLVTLAILITFLASSFLPFFTASSPQQPPAPLLDEQWMY